MILVCKNDRVVLDLKYAIAVRLDENYIDIDFTNWVNKKIQIRELSDKEIDAMLAFIATYKNKDAVFVLEDVISKLKGEKK